MKKPSPIVLALISALVLSLIYVFAINHKSNSKNDEYSEVLSPYAKSKSIFAYFLKQKPKPKKIIYGYLPYWSIDKLKYLQLDKLTDIAYFGLYINADGTFRNKLDDGTSEPGWEHWQNDKDLSDYIAFAKKSGVRISLTVISHEDEISDKFLDCNECWTNLLNNLITQMDLHYVKDVNLNFEYVEFPDEDKQKKYTDFVRYINKELDKKYGSSFVTVATFADSFVKPRITNVEELGKYADGLFIMAYDFHQPNSSNAGPVAPIDGIGVHADYDINTMIKDYMRVVPPNKLILGVPYYGYNWVVEDEKELSKRIPGDDDKGFSQSQAYSDIMDTIIELKPEIKWDELGKVPYFTYKSPETGSTRQVYFENADSLKIKYELAKTNNFAGIGIWALGYDGGYQELWEALEFEFLR